MENKVDLLKGNIVKSLVKLSLPIMGTSLIQMVYNMTDMIWMGRVGSAAVTALGTAGIFMWISEGLAYLSRLGGQVTAAQEVGKGNLEKAKKYINNALRLTFIIALVYAAFLLIYSSNLIAFFHLHNAETALNAKEYLRVVSLRLVFSFFNSAMTGLILATGDSKTSFKANTTGLIINIILDPIFIFLCNLGVVGAGLATVIAQASVSFIYFRYIKNDEYIFDIKLFRKLDLAETKEIVKIGLPYAMQNIIFPIVAMFISRLVVTFGDDAIAVQRVGSQIESISWMTASGFAQAVNAFIAQNYGANNIERTKQGYYSALKIIIVWGLFTTTLLYFFAGPIFKIFLPGAATLAAGIDYLQILALSQLFMCLDILVGGAYSGFGRTLIPSVVGVASRLLRIPAAIYLSSLLGLTGVWWAITLCSILAGILLVTVFQIYLKKKLSISKG